MKLGEARKIGFYVLSQARLEAFPVRTTAYGLMIRFVQALGRHGLLAKIPGPDEFALPGCTTLAKGRLGAMLEKLVHRRIGHLSGINSDGGAVTRKSIEHSLWR